MVTGVQGREYRTTETTPEYSCTCVPQVRITSIYNEEVGQNRCVSACHVQTLTCLEACVLEIMGPNIKGRSEEGTKILDSLKVNTHDEGSMGLQYPHYLDTCREEVKETMRGQVLNNIIYQ